MNREKRTEIFRRLREQRPHPTTELYFTTPFELLVAVVLSAQATDVGVNKATAKLFPVANTPHAIRALGVDGLKTYIKTIGLFNSKAANIIKLCDQLIEQHDGEVPRSRAALEALPGVGRKTANVVLNTAFGEPHHRRGHAHLPGLEQDAHRAGKKRGGGGAAADADRAGRVQAGLPPLADSARALHLRGAQTQMRRVPHRRPLRVSDHQASELSPTSPESPAPGSRLWERACGSGPRPRKGGCQPPGRIPETFLSREAAPGSGGPVQDTPRVHPCRLGVWPSLAKHGPGRAHPIPALLGRFAATNHTS